MSVLIKGMKMPKSCNKCTFGDGYACYATGRTVQDEDWETTRSALCPLIELPPHGDLIDRDALIRTEHYDDHDVLIIDVNDIYNAPTILEAEEGE